MKKLINKGIMNTAIAVLATFWVICFNSCKQEHITLTTTSDLNMYSYLQQNSDYSLFKQIVDKAGYSSFLNTYGTYTLFATTNDGVNAYLKLTNRASVDNIDVATAKAIVGISVIADTLGTQYFTDGKLRTPTTIGQYLVTGTTNVGGVTRITINKQANLVTGNIRVGNGLIHAIDFVLIPAGLTLAQTVEQNPKYTIFTAALKATGLYDTLNVAAANNPKVNRKYLTLIAQTDSVFKAAGFADYNALKSRYSTKNDPKNHADSLWLFMSYRIWPELSYVSDITNSDSHNTLAPLEVTTSMLVGQNLLLNNDTFNGILEPGQKIDRPTSDVSATNGVLHSVLSNYAIKIRFPSPVYFDVANQSEIIRTPGVYRVSGKSANYALGTLSGIALTGTPNGEIITYTSENFVTTTNYYYNNDHLTVGTRFRQGVNATNTASATFRTPVIVKGKYKVWIDYLRTNSQAVPVAFDGANLPNILNPGDGLNALETDAQAESRGFKSYSEAPAGTSTTNGYSGFVGRFVGIVDIPTTDHHTISFTATTGSNSAYTFQLDVIEFRPVAMDQIHPRLGKAGNLIP